ncbi:hypothetical protein ES703_105420 [subsurface metagenome]
MVVDVLDCLFSQLGQNLHMLKTGCDGSCSPPSIFTCFAGFNGQGGFGHGPVVLDIAVGGHIQ